MPSDYLVNLRALLEKQLHGILLWEIIDNETRFYLIFVSKLLMMMMQITISCNVFLQNVFRITEEILLIYKYLI